MAEVEYNFQQEIAWIIINRPEKKNSINDKVMEGLESSLNKAKEDRAKVIIFQGNGNFFSAGADINMFFNMDEGRAAYFSKKGNEIMDSIENYQGITISAIEGGALGGGFELALSTDIRITTKDSKLGLPEITLGIFPGWGGIKRITRAIGHSYSKFMVMTGKIISGEDAYNMGLVHELSPNPKEASAKLGNELRSLNMESISMIKELIRQDIYSTDLEAKHFGKIVTSSSAKPFLERFKKK